MTLPDAGPANATTPSDRASLQRRLREALARVTSGGRYIPLIDGLRFVAIAAVVLYHLNDFLVHKLDWVGDPSIRRLAVFRTLHVGNCGVQLFFAISGFILGLPFLERLLSDKPLKLRQYFLRRITRLEPPYIINLCVATALLMVVKGESIGELVAPLAASLGYLHNIVYGEMSRINGVAWSLEIEVQFYILAPLIAWGIYRRSKPVRRALVLLLIAAAVAGKMLWADALDPRLRLSLLYQYEHFLVGMLLADVYVTDWNRAPAQHLIFDALCLIAWPAIVWVQWSPVTYPLLPLWTLAAYYCTFRSVWLSVLLCRPWITTIGGMCYTIYLYHFYVISLVGGAVLAHGAAQLGYLPAILLLTLAVCPMVLASSAVLFAVAEKPFMIWRPFAADASQSAPTDRSILIPESVTGSVANS